MPTITDGSVTLEVTLIHPPAEPEQQERVGQEQFLRWWRDECRTRGLPAPRLTGADRAVARRLLDKHGFDGLKRLAVHYFRRHTGGIRGETHEMVAFASRIPEIQAELKDMA